MSLPYPAIRETRRMRRWFETGGAAFRLVAAVCASPADRATVTAGVVAGGTMRHVALDVTDGPMVPDAFRDFRGTHTSSTLFTFEGLGERVRRDGTSVLVELERAEPAFSRNATWALLWLDDPALPLLIERHAPRLASLVELHPTFTDPALLAVAPSGQVERMLATITGSGKSSVAPQAAAELLLERGDLATLRRHLESTAIDTGTHLVIRARAERLDGDAQAAVASLAAAAATPGEHRADALSLMATTLARLGDADGAAATAAMARDAGASGRSAVRAALADIRSGAVAPDIGLAAAHAATVDTPEAARLLARHLSETAPDQAIAVLRRSLSGSAGDPVLRAALEIDLALLLTSSTDGHDEAAALIKASSIPLEAARIERGLARLAIARVAAGDDTMSAAERHLDDAIAAATTAHSPRELLECHWELAALAAVRGDLGRVVAVLEEIESTARSSGLREVAFAALERRAEALLLERQLSLAAGAVDQLESLALDLTWPDLERRALAARAEHLRTVGAHQDGARSFTEAAGIARDSGDEANAIDLEARADGALNERPAPGTPS